MVTLFVMARMAACMIREARESARPMRRVMLQLFDRTERCMVEILVAVDGRMRGLLWCCGLPGLGRRGC